MKTLIHWKNFFLFLKKPDYIKKEDSILNKLLLTFNSFLLNILLILPILVFYFLYLILTGEEVSETMHENVEKLYHPILLFSMVAILEEFTFRGFLTKFNPLLFSVSITGIIAIYVKKIFFHNMFFEIEGLKEIGILVLILFPLLLLIAKKYNHKIALFWKNNFNYLVYISTFLFAFAHFFNSENLDFSYLKTTLFQLIGAFILSFVRIRSGLFYAILLHFIWDMML